MIREEIIAKNLVPSVETTEYYYKTNSMNNSPYLAHGLSYARASDQFYFYTTDMLEEFERRVNHHRLRSEMKAVWNSLDNLKVSLIMNDLRPLVMQNACDQCANDDFYDCRHLPYEAVVKMHDIVCGKEKILAKNLVPSVETMEYYNKTMSMALRSYLLHELHEIRSGRVYFYSKDTLEEFERRVSHLRLREEMKNVWDSTTDKLKRSLIRDRLRPIMMQNVCAPCENDQFYDCRHLPYEAVVKMHDIVCGKEDVPPPIVYPPSKETLRQFHMLSKETRLRFGLTQEDTFFLTEEGRDRFEKHVEIVRLRTKILERFAGWTTEERMDFQSKWENISKHVGVTIDPGHGFQWTMNFSDLSLESVEKIHTLVCPPLQYHTPICPPVQRDEYIERATSLLHDVASLASQHRSMAEVLIGSSLLNFAARLVKRNVEDLKTLENYIRIALDPKNPFSLLFEKFDHLTSAQKEIVCGILDIKSGAEPAACRMADALVRLEANASGLETQMLMEFMKKVKM